jgi:ribonuclease HI
MEKFLVVKKPEYPNGTFANLYTDGACRGNGGKSSISGAGAVLFDKDSKVIKEFKLFLGYGKTNNVAEYKALILGLSKALELGIKIINVFVDSKLITEQVRGNYRVTKHRLKPLFNEVKNLESKFDKFRITHVYRHLNTHADRLANEAINNSTKSIKKWYT